MLKNSFEITARDGLILQGQSWLPGNDIVAVICVVHGFGGHIGRYENFADIMTGRGFAVFGIDLRGHGKSGGLRGYARSGDILLSDINDLIIEARKDYIDLPVFLFGHSMGGLLAANYVLKNRSRELSGVILFSPLFRLAFKPPSGKLMLGNFFGRFIPSFTLPYEIDLRELSTAYENMELTNHDNLVHHNLSYSLYKICLSGGEWAIKNAALKIIPALVCHGESDMITSPDASREFCNNCGKDVTFKLWEGMKHELLNEKRKDEVYQFIDNWIKGVLEYEDA